MTTNNELARLRKAFAAPGPAPEPGGCPPSDRIWLAVRGELPPADLRGILDHVATCSACAEDWRIAMAFEEEARATGAIAVPAARSRFGMRALRPFLVAAALVVATVTGYQLHQPLHQPKAPVSIDRGGEGEQTDIRSLLPTGHEVLSRDHFVLRWTADPRAESYSLLVSTSKLDLLFQKEGITGTTFQVPADALKGLRSGAKVSWLVTPVFPDGSQSPGTTFQAIVK
jgi:hypothetical protein